MTIYSLRFFQTNITRAVAGRYDSTRSDKSHNPAPKVHIISRKNSCPKRCETSSFCLCVVCNTLLNREREIHITRSGGMATREREKRNTGIPYRSLFNQPTNSSLVCKCVSRHVWSNLGDIFETLSLIVLHLSL